MSVLVATLLTIVQAICLHFLISYFFRRAVANRSRVGGLLVFLIVFFLFFLIVVIAVIFFKIISAVLVLHPEYIEIIKTAVKVFVFFDMLFVMRKELNFK